MAQVSELSKSDRKRVINAFKEAIQVFRKCDDLNITVLKEAIAIYTVTYQTIEKLNKLDNPSKNYFKN